MTDPRADFLQTIIASPDDDTPRLVYADWLDEHGGEPERAEFIRVQIERWRLDPYHLSCKSCKCGLAICNDLRRRERYLWAQGASNDSLPFEIATNWTYSLHGDSVSGNHPALFVRRGFIEIVSCPFADWLTHHAAIMRATPLREVALTTRPQIQPLADQPLADPVRYKLVGTNAFGVPPQRDDYNSIVLRALAELWPGIKFTLPPAPTDPFGTFEPREWEVPIRSSDPRRNLSLTPASGEVFLCNRFVAVNRGQVPCTVTALLGETAVQIVQVPPGVAVESSDFLGHSISVQHDSPLRFSVTPEQEVSVRVRYQARSARLGPHIRRDGFTLSLGD